MSGLIWIIIILLALSILSSVFNRAPEGYVNNSNYWNWDRYRNRRRVCRRTGCSKQICADRNIATTCEHRCEYDCYRNAICSNTSTGCRWTRTPQFNRCINRCRRNNNNNRVVVY